MTTRDGFPDALRGFALIGIVLVNAPFFSVNTVLGLGGADVSNGWNSVPVFFITSLALGKFYLLFSLSLILFLLFLPSPLFSFFFFVSVQYT